MHIRVRVFYLTNCTTLRTQAPTHYRTVSPDPVSHFANTLAKMNDEQVKAQIQQLVSFIRQEAQDKASEIRAKAEEDFNIRKLSAVQKEREKIRLEHAKRTKAIEINRKMYVFCFCPDANSNANATAY